jgi:hypothetical protein
VFFAQQLLSNGFGISVRIRTFAYKSSRVKTNNNKRKKQMKTVSFRSVTWYKWNRLPCVPIVKLHNKKKLFSPAGASYVSARENNNKKKERQDLFLFSSFPRIQQQIGHQYYLLLLLNAMALCSLF